jgi:hypothetical protein
VLIKLPAANLVDDKEGKPVGIQSRIGRRPIAAFGNSDGDLQMLQWATAGSGPRFALIVAPRRWEAGVGVRPEVARRQARRGLGRGGCKGLDGRQHEGQLAIDLQNEVKLDLPELLIISLHELPAGVTLPNPLNI